MTHNLCDNSLDKCKSFVFIIHTVPDCRMAYDVGVTVWSGVGSAPSKPLITRLRVKR